MDEIIPVILCGGSGTRLWPLSRRETPKQFLRLMNDQTLLQQTVKRVLNVFGTDGSRLVTVTLRSMMGETIHQLEEISPALTRHLILEPQARNTAAAVALTIQYVQEMFHEKAKILILPADHYIGNEERLAEAINNAKESAEQGYMMAFGIKPTRPETGYGYIRKGKNIDNYGVCHVDSFLEKPAPEEAKEFVNSGEYLWNSGMHFFRADAGHASYKKFAPHIWEVVRNARRESLDPKRPSAMVYGTVDEQPFEKAIMEKEDKIAVIPCDLQWSDIGCWESLWEVKEKDDNGNAFSGNVFFQDTRNSMILAESRLVTCVGLSDVIIIETDDSLLVADRRSNGSLKALVKKLQEINRVETERLSGARHNWGISRMLFSSPRMRLQEHIIYPGQSWENEIENGSSQWIVAAGNAAVCLENSRREMKPNDTMIMPQGTLFTLINPHSENLKIFELQYPKKSRATEKPKHVPAGAVAQAADDEKLHAA